MDREWERFFINKKVWGWNFQEMLEERSLNIAEEEKRSKDKF